MMRASGPKDSNAFFASVRGCSGYLPPKESLTYQGVFNQHFFQTGEPDSAATVAIASRLARVPPVDCLDDLVAAKDVWLGCFLKSCRDGQPRDATPIDIVAVLDVSGSMGGCISRTQASGQGNRLQLAQEALVRLFCQLRPDDRLGLATFTTEASVIQQLELAENIAASSFEASVRALRQGGGTTIQAGLQAAADICDNAPMLTGKRHRRLLFLTDMDDMRPEALSTLIGKQAEKHCYVSFVCIGMEFNSKLAGEVTKHPGANYFCITRDEEMQKVIVDDFDWNFFPAAFEVEVAQQSDAFELVGVYGTQYETRIEEEVDWRPDDHSFYPEAFKDEAKELLLCSQRYTGHLPSPALKAVFDCMSSSARTVIRVDTVFPSAVSENAAIEGGLILLRLRPKSPDKDFGSVRFMLRYLDDGVAVSKATELTVASASDVAQSPDSAVRKGVMLQRFVEVCKDCLSAVAEAKHAPQSCIKDGTQPSLTPLQLAHKKANALLSRLREEADSEQLEADEVKILGNLERFVKQIDSVVDRERDALSADIAGMSS
eukprot:TRINITY_DN6156_c0_g1_i3.p1 TRINITY_DN6156_c0_g1~~TRINITY_DN6156_c0_g1_i3.p1  ORF type:complete len:546 (-),score=104.82 TRINITY_DN6156_c0_g1_i3:168-1805(-)